MISRIIQIRKEYGVSQEEFAKRLGLSRNFINQVENGKKNFSDRTISDICQEFNINEEWLRNGTPPMEREYDMDEYSEITTIIGEKDPKAKQAIIEYWKLSESDKELFWNFVNRFILKEGD